MRFDFVHVRVRQLVGMVRLRDRVRQNAYPMKVLTRRERQKDNDVCTLCSLDIDFCMCVF